MYNFSFKQDIFYHLVKTTQELFSFQQSRLDKQFPFHYAKIEKCINSRFWTSVLKSYMIWISDSCDFFGHWKQTTSCKWSFVNRKCTKNTNCSMLSFPFNEMKNEQNLMEISCAQFKVNVITHSLSCSEYKNIAEPYIRKSRKTHWI